MRHYYLQEICFVSVYPFTMFQKAFKTKEMMIMILHVVFFLKSVTHLQKAKLQLDTLVFLLSRRGPHSATLLQDAADVITASTSAVLLFAIFTLVTVWLRHSGAARDSLPKLGLEKGAPTCGTVADIHRSRMATSLGRAFALVMHHVSSEVLALCACCIATQTAIQSHGTTLSPSETSPLPSPQSLVAAGPSAQRRKGSFFRETTRVSCRGTHFVSAISQSHKMSHYRSSCFDIPVDRQVRRS